MDVTADSAYQVEIAVRYRAVWQDGFGARGWKLDVALDAINMRLLDGAGKPRPGTDTYTSRASVELFLQAPGRSRYSRPGRSARSGRDRSSCRRSASSLRSVPM